MSKHNQYTGLKRMMTPSMQAQRAAVPRTWDSMSQKERQEFLKAVKLHGCHRIEPHPADNACPCCGENLDGVLCCQRCEARGLFEMQLHLLTSSEGLATLGQRWVLESWGWPAPIWVKLKLKHQKMSIAVVSENGIPGGYKVLHFERVGRCRQLVIHINLHLLSKHGLPGAPYCDHDYYMPF